MHLVDALARGNRLDLADALCAVLDQQPWPTTDASTVVHRPDELTEIDPSD